MLHFFYWFNGNPQIIAKCFGERDKGNIHYNNFFAVNGTQLDLRCNYPTSAEPLGLDSYKSDFMFIAKQLSQHTSFLRVDIYLCNNKIYVGELTMYHWSGMGHFSPPEWDKTLGDWLKLPEK